MKTHVPQVLLLQPHSQPRSNPAEKGRTQPGVSNKTKTKTTRQNNKEKKGRNGGKT
jgi:hypothetical protein